MPGWLPPADVRFDHDAARTALDAIRDAIGRVEDELAQTAMAVALARRTWRGRRRDQFDDRWSHREAELRRLLDGLTALQWEVATAVEHARSEQHRRDRLQAHWRRELREERAK